MADLTADGLRQRRPPPPHRPPARARPTDEQSQRGPLARRVFRRASASLARARRAARLPSRDERLVAAGGLLALSLALGSWALLALIPWTWYFSALIFLASVAVAVSAVDPAVLKWVVEDAGVLDIVGLVEEQVQQRSGWFKEACVLACTTSGISVIAPPAAPREEMELLVRGIAPKIYPKLASRRALLPRGSGAAFEAAQRAWAAAPKTCASLQLRGLALLRQAQHGDYREARLDGPLARLRAAAWRDVRGLPVQVAREQFVSLAWKACPQLWKAIEPAGADPDEQRAEALAAVVDRRLAGAPAMAALPLLGVAALLRRFGGLSRQQLIAAFAAYAYAMWFGLPLRVLEWKYQLGLRFPLWQPERYLQRKVVRAMRIARLLCWALVRHMLPRVRPNPALESYEEPDGP